MNADVLLVQKDVEALLCVELHLILVSGPDAALQSSLSVTAGSFQEVSLETQSLVVWPHLADSHTGEACTKLSLGHPDAVGLLWVVVELIKQLLSPVGRFIGILAGPWRRISLPNISYFEEAMEGSCGAGFNDAVGVCL